jgi:hypothetical protein
MKRPAAAARSKKPAPPSSPPAPASAQPTTIAGVKPERFQVDVDELHQLAPTASQEVRARALRLLQALTVNMLTRHRAQRWGQEAQQACQDRFGRGAVPASAPFVDQARAAVSRMTDVLGAIDLKAVCGHAKGGLLGGLARTMSRQVDTPAKLADAVDELRSLLQGLDADVGRLLALKDGLRQRAGGFEQIQLELEAATLAARFLSSRLAGNEPAVAQQFAECSLSLAATLAQSRQGDNAYQTHIRRPLQLIDAIQNVALTRLPAFINELAALQALAKSGQAFPAEALNMSYRLRDIIHQLNQEDPPCQNRNLSSST